MDPAVDDGGDGGGQHKGAELWAGVGVGGVQDRQDAVDGGKEVGVQGGESEVDGRGGVDYGVDAVDGRIEGAGYGDVGDQDVLIVGGIFGVRAFEEAIFGRGGARSASDGVAGGEELETDVRGDVTVDAGDEDDSVRRRMKSCHGDERCGAARLGVSVRPRLQVYLDRSRLRFDAATEGFVAVVGG